MVKIGNTYHVNDTRWIRGGRRREGVPHLNNKLTSLSSTLPLDRAPDMCEIEST